MRGSYDLVIVGAGIVGAACAMECARAGLKIAVLDRGPVGAGSTGACMGHIVVMEDSEAQFSLTRYSRQLWHEIAPQLPEEVEYDQVGTLWIATDDEEMAEVRRKELFARKHGLRAEGLKRVEIVTLTNGQKYWTEHCDYLACGFGLVPNVELPIMFGCALRGGVVQVNERQETSVPRVFCAGEPTGVGGVDCALVEGEIAGLTASGRSTKTVVLFGQRRRWHAFRRALNEAFRLREELKTISAADTLVCRCEDVSFGRLRGFSSWRDAKLQTRCGMGPCQGRICGGATHILFGWDMESVRPPVLPSSIETLATAGKLTEAKSVK